MLFTRSWFRLLPLLAVLVPFPAGAQLVMKTHSMDQVFGHSAPPGSSCTAARGCPSAAARAPVVVIAHGTAVPPKKPLTPTAWSVPGARHVSYDRLELRILSGSVQRRMATINNETFIAGETLRVALGPDRVPVKCVEIRDKSVLVKVGSDPEPRELQLVQSWR